jgi:hypothetical protein
LICCVIKHDLSAVESALGDVVNPVCNVDAVGAKHGQRPTNFGLTAPLSLGAALFWGGVLILGSGVQI